MKLVIFFTIVTLFAVKIDGYSVNPKIVNGKTSKPGQFPYQAMLIGTVFGGQILCGGSLISDQWVVTAGHCVSDVLQVDVHLGAQSFRNRTEPGRLILRADKTILHENYVPSLAANDIALVRLSNKVKFNDRIQPVSLPSSSDSYAGKTVIASGWGLKATSDTQPASELQFAELQVITNNKCAETFDPIIVRSTTICAQGLSYESVCSGDSGGPLVLKDNKTLVGVTSFGHVIGCDYGLPGGFSRVSSYINWINSKIRVSRKLVKNSV